MNYTLMVESIKNGMYCREYKKFSEKEYNELVDSCKNKNLEGNMLEDITVKEKFLIENKKVYASAPELKIKRELDGCDVRIHCSKAIDELSKQAKWLEEELIKINREIIENKKIDNALAALGYCKKDTPVYKKTAEGVTLKDANGNAIITSYTHQNDCVNKEV